MKAIRGRTYNIIIAVCSENWRCDHLSHLTIVKLGCDGCSSAVPLMCAVYRSSASAFRAASAMAPSYQ